MADIPKEKSTRLQTILKIVFFVAAFFIVIFTVLANMGGNSEGLRSTVEQLATDTTGYQAKLGKLNNVTFFPSISVDVENLELFRAGIKDVPAIRADRIRTSMGFWDVTFRNGRIKALAVENVRALSGVFLDRPITIDTLAIADTSADEARMEIRGSIGAEKLNASVSMDPYGFGKARRYAFGPSRVLRAALGDLGFSAALINAEFPHLAARDIKITYKGQEVLAGDIEVMRRNAAEMAISGAVTLLENASTLKPDLILNIETRKITGTIRSDNFSAADFAAASRFDAALAALLMMLMDIKPGAHPVDQFFSGRDIMLDVSGKTNFKGPLMFENGRLKIK